MFNNLADVLQRELLKRMQAVQQLLEGREIEVDVDLVEDQPPADTERAPDAFVAPDPIFGGASMMQQFNAMTAPVSEPFAKRRQMQQQEAARGAQNIGAASEEDKEAAVLLELEDVMSDQFPGYYYKEDF